MANFRRALLPASKNGYRHAMKALGISFFLLLVAVVVPVAQAEDMCGVSIEDWCTGPKDDACGRHLNTSDCLADTACVAVRYSGESMVACHWDERGFADNCPAVGCRNR